MVECRECKGTGVVCCGQPADGVEGLLCCGDVDTCQGCAGAGEVVPDGDQREESRIRERNGEGL